MRMTLVVEQEGLNPRPGVMLAPGPGVRNGGKQVTSLHTARGEARHRLSSKTLKILNFYYDEYSKCILEKFSEYMQKYV